MLNPIHRVACSPALEACQQLMQCFALWLCNPATTSTDLSKIGLQPPVLASAIEATWLWDFLQDVDAGQSLLVRAQTVASMPNSQKAALTIWIRTVAALRNQFQAAQTPWPITRPVTNELHWKPFKTLMEAFYTKGFRKGLPYLPNGTPVAAGGVNYESYVASFRKAHLLSAIPDTREVCVLCGGPLGDKPHVDHWIMKSAFPLLSVCADNLQLICNTCNEAPNKGQKHVHSNGSFANWFHPYLRPGNQAIRLDYVLPELSVKCSAGSPIDHAKVANIDALLNLSSRWTREFKAEYAKHQKSLIRQEQRRRQNAHTRYTEAEILAYVQEWQANLDHTEPHFEVHRTLAKALQEPTRLASWHSELGIL